MFNRNQILILVALVSLFSAIVYGVATYQTPYGCGSQSYRNATIIQPNATRNDLNNQKVSWQVLFEPCFYVYFVGIVGGSMLIIYSIPHAKNGARVVSSVNS